MTRPSQEAHELIRVRRKKLEALRELGVEPYARRFSVSHSTREIIERYGGMTREELEGVQERFSVAGRIMALRSFGKATFAHIQDAHGRLQIYARVDVLGKDRYRLLEYLDLGDWIGVQGRLFRTRTNELTLEVSDWCLLSKALRPLPEKWHGLTDVELRYRQRYLDLMVNPRTRWVFRTRSRLIRALREFLDQHGFLEVETPMMHPLPGGAAARPFVTHHNALDGPVSPHCPGTLLEAPHRRRTGTGVRNQPELPQRGHLLRPQSGIYHAGVLCGLLGL